MKQKAKHTYADMYKALYDSFLAKGFTPDQAFELLLVVIKQEKKK